MAVFSSYPLDERIRRAQAAICPDDFVLDGAFDEHAYLRALEIVEDEILDGYINQ